MIAHFAIVIPARMGSTRFPGKPLVDLAGKAMVHWVVDAARQVPGATAVLVATPDLEIGAYCDLHQIDWQLTRADHPSGTDRLAEVAASREEEIFVNVQGDEPLIPAASIEAVARTLMNAPGADVASLYGELEMEGAEDHSVVKVVTDLNDRALYFSRHPIPYPRNPRLIPLKKHIGIYAYRRDALLAFPGWPQTPLEVAESLEQLRFLEHGMRIAMARGEASPLAVDTPAHADAVRKLLRMKGVLRT